MTEQLSELTIIAICAVWFIILSVIIFNVVKKAATKKPLLQKSVHSYTVIIVLIVYVVTFPFVYLILSGRAYEWYSHYKIIKDFEESTEVVLADNEDDKLIFDEEQVDGFRDPQNVYINDDYDAPTSKVMEEVLKELEKQNYHWRGYSNTENGVEVSFYYKDEKKAYGHFIECKDEEIALKCLSETFTESEYSGDIVRIRDGGDGIKEVVTIQDNYILFGSFDNADDLFDSFIKLCNESW